MPETVKGGASLATERVLAVAGYAGGPEDRHFELAFPRPGGYRARVQYEDLISNVVTIQATKPMGKDEQVLAHLLRRPELLSEWGLIEDFGGPVLEKLLDEYPTSRHLAHPRVLAWRRELDEARAADPQAATRALDGRTAELLAKLEAATVEDTSFEEDRLLLIGDAAVSIGDRGKARAAYERVTSLNPSSAAAMKAKRWLTVEDRAVSRDQLR